MVQLNKRTLEFKVNTGADVTVIPETAYRPNEDRKLETALIPLNGHTGGAWSIQSTPYQEWSQEPAGDLHHQKPKQSIAGKACNTSS